MKNTNKRAGKAVARYLELTGFRVVDRIRIDSKQVVVAWDGMELVFADVRASRGSFPGVEFDREAFEGFAADYLVKHPELEPDFSVRADIVSMFVADDHRAMVRHFRNVSALA